MPVINSCVSVTERLSLPRGFRVVRLPCGTPPAERFWQSWSAVVSVSIHMHASSAPLSGMQSARRKEVIVPPASAGDEVCLRTV
jgi:hypothetical protein